jgi:hypothetical protein
LDGSRCTKMSTNKISATFGQRTGAERETLSSGTGQGDKTPNISHGVTLNPRGITITLLHAKSVKKIAVFLPRPGTPPAGISNLRSQMSNLFA